MPIWSWIVLFLGLSIGFIALVVAVIVIIKIKKFLVPILIYIPFLIFSLVLIGIFVWQVVVYFADNNYDDLLNYNYNYNYNYNTNSDLNDNLNYNLNSDFNLNLEPDYTSEGKIQNLDYNFIITVGEKHAAKIFETKDYWPLDGITDTYYYCYQVSDANYYEESGYCLYGEATAFSINIYTKAQWQDVKDSPFVGSLMGQDGGYYFVLSHPNGILPDEVPTTEEFYNKVITSIDFAD